MLGKKEGLSEKQAADLIIRDARQFLQVSPDPDSNSESFTNSEPPEEPKSYKRLERLFFI